MKTTFSLGLTAMESSTPSPIEPGGTFDVQFQEQESNDILASDDEGKEFPAPEGWYFKQFVPHDGDWLGVDGWFGPYASVEAMPQYVRDNLTRNRPENA